MITVASAVVAQTSTQPTSRRRAPAASRSAATPTPASQKARQSTSAPVAAAEAAAVEKGALETTTTEGGVQVGYSIDVARSWYEFTGGVLSWKDAGAGETNHLLVTVLHAGSRRTIPGCKVTASLNDSANKDVVSSVPLAFTWNEEFSYYGGNMSVPETTDSLTLHVRIEPPEFRRLDKETGGFFAKAITLSFAGVKVVERTRPEKKTDPQPEKGAILEGRHPAITPTPYPGSRPTTEPLSM